MPTFPPVCRYKDGVEAFPGLKEISPVLVPPRVNVCAFVVWIFPFASNNIPAPLSPDETEAVGVPFPVMLVTANLAVLVACPPSRRSSVELNGVTDPVPVGTVHQLVPVATFVQE